MSVRVFKGSTSTFHCLQCQGLVDVKEELLYTVGHHLSVCLPSVYMASLHMIKSPRPSPSVFVCCKRSNIGGGKGLRTRLCYFSVKFGIVLFGLQVLVQTPGMWVSECACLSVALTMNWFTHVSDINTCLSTCLSNSPSTFLSQSLHLSFCQSLHLSPCLSPHLSLHLSVHMSVHLSVCLSVSSHCWSHRAHTRSMEVDSQGWPLLKSRVVW